MTAPLDEAALAKAAQWKRDTEAVGIREAGGWTGLWSEISETARRQEMDEIRPLFVAYLEALPPAKRMWAWFPDSNAPDYRYWAFFQNEDDARESGEFETCKLVEIREIREPAAGEGK